MQSDSLFFQLFQQSPQVFFELVGTPLPPSGLYSFVSQEVKQTRFQIDGIFLPHHRRSDLPLYFVEVMGYKPQQGKHFYQELFTEIYLYLNGYQPRNDWKAVVIYTKRRFDPGIPIHLSEYINSPRLQIVYLDQMSMEQQVNPSLEVCAIHLINTRKTVVAKQAKFLIERAKSESTDALNQRNILELINTILIYKFPELTRQEIEAMLGLSELKQTKVYQEAKEEGRQEGRQEGQQEGRQEGRQEEKHNVVQRLLGLGLTLEQIAQAVDLPVGEVQAMIPTTLPISEP